MSGLNVLPSVKQIRGATTHGGAAPADALLSVQYSDHGNQWHELRMPLLEAMKLLAYLEIFRLKEGLPVPRLP